MTRTPLVAAFLWLACVVSVRADPVGYYGNTLIIKRSNGSGTMIYRPDHTFSLTTIVDSPFHGAVFDGPWTVKGAQLCLTPTNPAMAPFCIPDDPVHKPGDVWNVVSPDGHPEELTLVAGQAKK